MLPIDSTIDVTRLLMGIAFAGYDTKKKMQEKELDTQVSRMRIEADTYLQEMRIESRMNEVNAQKEIRINEVNAQKEIYLSLVELSKHAYDRKMDFFLKSFGEFMTLLAQQQKILDEELKGLRYKEHSIDLSDLDKMIIVKTRTDIMNELAEVRGMSEKIMYEFNMRVSNLAPDVRLAIPRL